MSEKPLLEMIGIDKTFGRQTVLKNCSLEVQRGETVVLIGPSGSGKSTLLRCVNMLSPADSGDIFFASQHISRGEVPVHKLRQRIGMVFQNYELFSHLTAAENIMLAPMTVLGMNRIDARTLADNLLAKVRINERADHFPDELSGGTAAARGDCPCPGDEARADALRRTHLSSRPGDDPRSAGSDGRAQRGRDDQHGGDPRDGLCPAGRQQHSFYGRRRNYRSRQHR